MSKPLF